MMAESVGTQLYGVLYQPRMGLNIYENMTMAFLKI